MYNLSVQKISLTFFRLSFSLSGKTSDSQKPEIWLEGLFWSKSRHYSLRVKNKFIRRSLRLFIRGVEFIPFYWHIRSILVKGHSTWWAEHGYTGDFYGWMGKSQTQDLWSWEFWHKTETSSAINSPINHQRYEKNRNS